MRFDVAAFFEFRPFIWVLHRRRQDSGITAAREVFAITAASFGRVGFRLRLPHWRAWLRGVSKVVGLLVCVVDSARENVGTALLFLVALEGFHDVVSILLEQHATHGTPWEPMRSQEHTGHTLAQLGHLKTIV